MEYKQLGILFIVLALMFAVVPLILAEDASIEENSAVVTSTETTETADINTESEDIETTETVSQGEIVKKQIGLWFTFNQEKIAEKQLELAKLRLIQARIAAKNNNTEAMEKALEAHERILTKFQERMEKVKAKNVSAEKLTGLERAIQVHEARITKMETILANAELTDAQRTRIEAKIAHAENVTSHLRNVEAKIEEKPIVYANIIEEAKAKNTTVKLLAAQKAIAAREAKKLAAAKAAEAANTTETEETVQEQTQTQAGQA